MFLSRGGSDPVAPVLRVNSRRAGTEAKSPVSRATVICRWQMMAAQTRTVKAEVRSSHGGQMLDTF